MSEIRDPVQKVLRELGNDVHSALIYETPVDGQRALVRAVREGGIDASGLDAARELARRLREVPGGAEALVIYDRGIVALLEREIREARPIANYEHAVLGRAFHELGYDAIEGSIVGPVYRIEAKRSDRSPEDDGSFVLWRDTEAHVTIHTDRDLLVWRYLNVAPAFRGEGFGTETVRTIEAAALSFGITRFSVEWANLEFWARFGYRDYPDLRVGSGEKDYHPEAYREDRSA